MLEQIKEGIFLLLGVFLALTLILNMNPRLPRIPWDILLDKFGFRVYLPVTSAIVITVVLSMMMNLFN